MWTLHRRVAMAGGLAALATAAVVTAAPADGQARSSPSAPRPLLAAGLPAASLGGPCLLSGKAYLRARIRGAVRLDVDLHGRGLKCEGGPRLDGSGLRMGFEGRTRRAGRVRMIFGIDRAKEGRAGRELPTNLTVFFEDRKLLFATQGDSNCTVDRLTQEPISAGHAPNWPQGAGAPTQARSTTAKTRAYRVVAKPRAFLIVAHGFCIAPVNDLGGRQRVVVTTFDFAGRADFDTP